MKLKNSYILIAIAIFLLITIGSVCASENIIDDSDAQLADDGTNVVLSEDTDANVADDTTQEKINTTVETDDNSYEYKQDENKTFTVTVKDNKSSPIDINKSSLSVSNGNKNISFEYNNSIIKITEQLPCGNYNLTINYLGNATYINSSAIISVKIYGNNTIKTETIIVCDGKNIAVPVKIYNQVDYIELIKDNFNLTLVYTNETGNVCNLTITSDKFNIDNGTIKFESPVDLINASLIINYANATEAKTVDIKVSTEVQANVDKDKFKSEEIKNISIRILDGQGNLLNINKNDLKVFDNGNEITDFSINNTNLTLNLGVGVHNITIKYLGNDTYNESNSQAIEIKVSGKNTIITPDYIVVNGNVVEIPVTLFDGSENITATENFNLTLTYTNSTGNVTTKVALVSIDPDGVIRYNIGDIKLINASATINYVNSTGAKTVKIKLLTSVDAQSANEKYRFNETNNITVTVLDAAGNPINATAFNVYDNGNKIRYTLVNSTMTVNLGQGVHNLTITYVGDETYNSSSKSITVKVNGDARINPDESIVLDGKSATIYVNYNDGADNIDIINEKLNVTLFWTEGNQTKNKTITGFTLTGQNITFDIDENFDTAYVLIKYDANLTGETSIKVNTEITASDFQASESQVKNFTIGVKGTNDHVINITDKNIQVLKDGKPLNIAVNNSVITIKDALSFGVYNLTIKYLGTENYLVSNRAITLTVLGINASSSVNVNSSKKVVVKFDVVNGNETVTISTDDLNITVTYKVGNETKVISINDLNLINGNLTFELENANFTTATLTISYNNGTAVKNVTLNRVYYAKIEIVNAENEYSDGNFTFKLVDVDDGQPIAGKSLSLAFPGNIRVVSSATTDKDGIASFVNANLYTVKQENGFEMNKLDVGKHLIELTTDGNVKSTSVTTNLTVTHAIINIKIDEYKEFYGSDKKVKITVTNAKSGDVVKGIILHLYMPQTAGRDYYLQTNNEGVSEIAVKGLVGGDYDVTVNNNDTTNMANASTKTKITIVPKPVVINAKDINIYFNSGTTQTVKITDKSTGKALEGIYVLVQIDKDVKKTYLFQTNNKGEISFSASLPVGKHKITIATADKRYSGTTVTTTVNVKKASAAITAKKVTDYYKGVKYFTVKLTNSKNKKPIYDAKMNIKIFVSKNRYYNYVGNTGMNGQLKLALDTLKPGTYKVVVSGADSKDFSAKQVTSKIVIKKAPAKLTPKKLTAKKGAKKYFKVTVKNKKTKKVIAGVKIKIKVYTGKKAKTYTVKTNAKGIAQISTAKLKVGKHKVVISSANKYVTAKKAKSTIKIKK